MRFGSTAELEELNRRTLAAIHEGTAMPDAPYYGYYRADIFDCPAFLMFTNNDCPRAVEILHLRNFELGSMSHWCRLARSASTIFDIGAHVGVYTLAAAALRPALAIHAFEPNPYAFARLRIHKYVNGFENVVEHQTALAEIIGITKFGWTQKPNGQIPSGGKFLVPGKKYASVVEKFPTPVTTLDSIAPADLGDRGLIKIDVEGAENLVFKGMNRVLLARPDIIIETFSQANCDMINAAILPLGYRVFLIDEESGGLIPQDRLLPRDGEQPNYNQFLTARPEEALMRGQKS